MRHAQKTPNPPLSHTLAEFPRRHLLLAGGAIVVVFFFLLLSSTSAVPTSAVAVKRTSQPLELQVKSVVELEVPTATISQRDPLEITVGRGDNLSLIFQRANLSAAAVHDIISNSDNSKSLLNLYPKQKLAFQIDDDGTLQALQHIRSEMDSTLFERDGDKFVSTLVQREPEIRHNYSGATIKSSLYMAAQDSGLSQNLIMEFANIFGGVVDFVYDVRSGDSFNLLYEEHFLDDVKRGNGAILAAQFRNRGETFTAYRYVYEDGSVGYFNGEGISMRKAFLRAPLDFRRISSSFNLKRLHPIFKTTKPHRGIDYAAARGTPVYAAGDGRVAKAGYSKANGNYVFINHGTQYQTKYLHLHKRSVKTGQRIKQQQIIGSVGSTGYATGPHLHYEFLVNGVHRNPRTIIKKLPKAKSIASTEKPKFLKQISGLRMQLAAYNNQQEFAAASQSQRSNTL